MPTHDSPSRVKDLGSASRAERATARGKASARDVTIEPMRMERDFAGVDRLLALEEWPFVRADLEVSHAQPRGVAMVARQNGEVIGFFATHHFGDVGYLDMTIIHPAHRCTQVARRLTYETHRRLRDNGMTGFVAHSTNESFRVFRFFRFKPGADFTLMRREVAAEGARDAMRVHSAGTGKLADSLTHGARGGIERFPAGLLLTDADGDAIVSLDARVFGVERRPWIDALMRQPSVCFVGERRGGELIASACLRPRRHGGVCIDAANAERFDDLRPLIDRVIDALPHLTIDCFARTGGDLHAHLAERGFTVPGFFQRIGPLVEWRQGDTEPIGVSDLNRTLSWF